jgi:hypothetical protein
MKTLKFITFLTVLLTAAYTNTAWAEENKVKDWIDSGADALKKGVDELGSDAEAIQDYLDNYHWKGIVEDKARSGPATLKELELNGDSRAIVVKPGERIEAKVRCKLDKEQCSLSSVYRIVVGLQGEGPQAVIGNELGLVAGKSKEEFALIAPQKAGIYQIRFRAVEAYLESSALDAWKDQNGNEPDGTTTIGIIVVKE